MKARKPQLLGVDDIVRILQVEVRKVGSQSDFARKRGINASSLSHIFLGRRGPTKDILRALSLQKVFAYATSKKERNSSIIRLQKVVLIIRREVEKVGGQAEFAKATGISRSNLNPAFLGRRPPTNDLLKVLKLRKVFAYERVSKTRR
jgi:transcriptional regulator with XRE-family HTH domain